MGKMLVGAVLMAVVGTAAGCSSSVQVNEVKIDEAPAASPAKVVIEVDLTKNNEQGEAVTLENGLKREFRSAGYEVLPGNLTVRCEIVELHRGSTVANVLIGLGAGGDHADIRVQVVDSSGSQRMSFLVRGSVHDKRYRELHEVIGQYVAHRIVEEVTKACR